jgi:hypothetical protein
MLLLEFGAENEVKKGQFHQLVDCGIDVQAEVLEGKASELQERRKLHVEAGRCENETFHLE